jgi:sodium/hydrogen exchanger 8
MGSEAGLDMFVVALLLLCCAFTAFYLERSKSSLVSESGVAMLLGMAVGGCFELRNADQAAAVAFKEEFFFYGLLPPIILEAGFSMKRRQFFSNFSTILLLAVVGTLVATFVIGSIISASGYLPSSEAFVYAALISAVDPVATLSVFKKVGAPEQLFNVVFGESVLNDAVAIVLFQIFDGMRPEHNGGSSEDSFDFTTGKKVEAVFKLLGIGLGSVVMAAATTLSTAYLLRRINARTGGALKHYPDLEISIVLLTTYLGYVLADLVELSGIVAIFFSGVMTSQYLAHNLSVAAQGALAHVLHMLAFLAENFVFIYLGLSVFTVSLEASQFEWNFGLIALSMVWWPSCCCCALLLATLPVVFPRCSLADCAFATLNPLHVIGLHPGGARAVRVPAHRARELRPQAQDSVARAVRHLVRGAARRHRVRARAVVRRRVQGAHPRDHHVHRGLHHAGAGHGHRAAAQLVRALGARAGGGADL